MPEPTKPNFKEYDKCELKPFSERFEKVLTVEHDFVDGSLVVSLNAPFGSGKSTFLSMWKADLDEHPAPDRPKAIMLNAWESDYCGDPLMSVVTGLIRSVSTDEPEKAAILTEAMKDIAWFTLGLAGKAIPALAGLTGVPILAALDPLAAAEFAQDKKGERNPQKPDFVHLYEARTDSLQRLKKALHDTFGGDAPKAFVFVDELDRCRPDYAISYLETIKHVFDVNGLVFILAVDRCQLESSAKALFGSGLNFDEYFRKFVHRAFSLPPLSENGQRALVQDYVERYLVKQDRRFSRLNHGELLERILQLINALKPTPRQLQEIFRIIGHAAGSEQQSGTYNKPGFGVALVFMATLKVAKEDFYRSIGLRLGSSLAIGEFLIGLFGKESADWWICIYLTGSHYSLSADYPVPEKAYVQLKMSGDENGARSKLSGIATTFWRGSYDDVFIRVYKKIENAEML